LLKVNSHQQHSSDNDLNRDVPASAVVGVSLVSIYQRGQPLNLTINVVQGQLPPTTSSVVGEDTSFKVNPHQQHPQ
jgi:hypothetical protein